MRVVRRVMKRLAPRKLTVLGDGLDAERFSRHRKRSRKERVSTSFFESEVRPMRDLLDYAERCGVEEITYLEGNHEERVERWITEEGGVWEDVADLIQPQALLEKGRAAKFSWVPYVPGDGSIQHVHLADDLIATHGWSCCKHAAAKHLADVGTASVIFGHIHRRQSATLRDPLSGRVRHGWCPGTLSKLQPIWCTPHPTQWSHGFSLVWSSNSGDSWTAYTPAIERGRCILPDGTKVSGR